MIVINCDQGDELFLVARGSGDVFAPDGKKLVSLGDGEVFGEIALLRNVKRTATVTACEESVVFSLMRDDFVPAVTGSAPSNAAAEAVVGARLGGLSRRPSLRP